MSKEKNTSCFKCNKPLMLFFKEKRFEYPWGKIAILLTDGDLCIKCAEILYDKINKLFEEEDDS